MTELELGKYLRLGMCNACAPGNFNLLINVNTNFNLMLTLVYMASLSGKAVRFRVRVSEARLIAGAQSRARG